MSCSKQHGERIKFLSVSMSLSSTLNAAQSIGMQLGASHKPLGGKITLVFFYETGFGLCHKLGSKFFYKINHYLPMEQHIS